MRRSDYEQEVAALEHAVGLSSAEAELYGALLRGLAKLAERSGWETTCADLETAYFTVYCGTVYSRFDGLGLRGWYWKEHWVTLMRDEAGPTIATVDKRDIDNCEGDRPTRWVAATSSLLRVRFRVREGHQLGVKDVEEVVWEREQTLKSLHEGVEGRRAGVQERREEAQRALELARFNLSLAQRVTAELTEYGEVRAWGDEPPNEPSADDTRSSSNESDEAGAPDLVHTLSDPGRRLEYIERVIMEEAGAQSTWRERTDLLARRWEEAGLDPDDVPYGGREGWVPEKMARAYRNYWNRKKDKE